MNFSHVSARTILPLLSLAALALLAVSIRRQPASTITPPAPSLPASVAPTTPHLADYGRLPLSFEANQGQADHQVDFLAHGSGYNLLLSPTQARFTLHPHLAAPGKKPMKLPPPATLCMRLVGALAQARAEGQEILPGKVNYFIGSDPAKWRTNISTYSKVRYSGVYPGIDLVYYGSQKQLEYDFVVAPHANPKTIRLDFADARSVQVDGQGELVLGLNGGEMHWHRPVIYQPIQGRRQPVAGRYVRHGRRQVGFEVARYDPNQPLIIDPQPSYCTYLGGSNQDTGSAIAVDSNGNAYVAGTTFSTNFPTISNAFQKSNGGSADTFVTKLSADGRSLVYSTYLGGSGSENGNGIAVDSNGNAYITGLTYSTNFPTTAGAFQTSHGGAAGHTNIFVTKLNATGSGLLYSTYLGITGGESANAIAIDSNGNAYITGSAGSGYLTTPSAFQTTWSGANDAIVTKLNATGSALIYSTYLGGSNSDAGTAIAVDSNGNAYVTGSTSSTDFPTTPGAYKRTYSGGGGVAFVSKLNATGSALLYSTYLGTDGSNVNNAIAIDSYGNAYVTGATSSTNFPTTPGAFQSTFSGGNTDAFVTKLNTDGSVLLYSTYLGGTGDDSGSAIAVDRNDFVYVAGSTSSTNFPTTPGAFKMTNSGGATDAFISKVNTDGSVLTYSTYLGGSSDDYINGVALDPAGGAYFVGFTASTDFPVTTGAFQTTYSGGGDDAFVAKFVFPLPFDFNGDGHNDLVFQNSTTNKVAIWYMNGPNVLGGAQVSLTPAAGYHVVGVGDYNGDGHPDIVFQNTTTGQIAIWYMNGANVIGGALASLSPASGYKVVGVGDFNGDGHPDIVFQNNTTNQIAFWYMSGPYIVGSALASQTPLAGYKVVGVGDFNGDGKPDIVFQNQTTNQIAVWYMNGPNVIGGGVVSLVPAAGYKVVAVADYNGDGKPDLVFQNSTNNKVALWYMNGLTFTDGSFPTNAPTAGYQVVGPR